jgi:hypothetical protein
MSGSRTPVAGRYGKELIVGASRWVVLVGLLGLLAIPADVRGQDKKPEALPVEEAWRKARVDGKYGMLLAQIKVEGDVEKYKDFTDYGFRTEAKYGEHNNLPKGHWVYVYPYWYIWRDVNGPQEPPKREWGPEQATGAPDTQAAGDIVTAWASLTEDGQDEWLMLEYADPVVPSGVIVYETFNPGAVNRITIFDLEGKEVEIWKDKDPLAGEDMGNFTANCKVKFKTTRVKVYLDSKNVAGWNEIDAVGLVDADGKTQWATVAHASTTYAEPAAAVVGANVQQMEARIKALEEEVRILKEEIEKLKKKN